MTLKEFREATKDLPEDTILILCDTEFTEEAEFYWNTKNRTIEISGYANDGVPLG